MKLYYVEFNPYENGYDEDIIAHYLEITDLGMIIEYPVQTYDGDTEYYLNNGNTYKSWGEYFATYKGGRKEFYRKGDMVRVL